MLAHRLTRLTTRLVAVPRTSASVRFYNPDQKGDPHDQSHQSGYAATDPKKASPADAASPAGGKQASRGGLSGNQEGVGFADQVGSQSSSDSDTHANTAQKPESSEGFGAEENITPPSFTDAVKNKLGFKTTAGEDKQNRGGGKGVTGTGNVTYDTAKRTMHTSAVHRMPAKTQGQAPEASRQPKDKTYSDQNAHLKHKKAGAPDQGKGNAAKDPKLPSHEVSRVPRVRGIYVCRFEVFQSDTKPSQLQGSSKPQKRGFHTSARAFEEKGSEKHTADSYFKDVDSTEPVNPKVHQVDSSSDTGAPVARANEQPATGHFSRAGPESPEYETVSHHGSQWGGEMFTPYFADI